MNIQLSQKQLWLDSHMTSKEKVRVKTQVTELPSSSGPSLFIWKQSNGDQVFSHQVIRTWAPCPSWGNCPFPPHRFFIFYSSSLTPSLVTYSNITHLAEFDLWRSAASCWSVNGLSFWQFRYLFVFSETGNKMMTSLGGFMRNYLEKITKCFYFRRLR